MSIQKSLVFLGGVFIFVFVFPPENWLLRNAMTKSWGPSFFQGPHPISILHCMTVSVCYSQYFPKSKSSSKLNSWNTAKRRELTGQTDGNGMEERSVLHTCTHTHKYMWVNDSFMKNLPTYMLHNLWFQ